MGAKRYVLWGGVLALVGGGLALTRPARIRAATVTTMTSGALPTAGIALTYGPGSAPASVIVDLAAAGSVSSATIAGGHPFVEVPLYDTLGAEYHITTTATYRVLGMLRTVVSEFAGHLP